MSTGRRSPVSGRSPRAGGPQRRARRQDPGGRGTQAGAEGGDPGPGCPVEVDQDASGAPSDLDLAVRSRIDPEAFGVLYDRYCDRIYRFVYSRVRDPGNAEDLTAEVFFKALRGITTYHPSAGSFSAWIFRIARNTVIDHLRARRPTVSLDPEFDTSDPAPPVEDRALDRVDVADVWRAVGELSSAQRAAVILRLQKDLPIAEIAITLNRSEGAVRVLLHRALGTLRKRLGESRARSQ